MRLYDMYRYNNYIDRHIGRCTDGSDEGRDDDAEYLLYFPFVFTPIKTLMFFK